ncbi:hypothetical protein [Burkholderia ambifaria]|uniref:hypothetical protein n=1 Tax=Burkholderia ambifaria TaxID=152480 RepID=UPI001592661D|nr:hypothetical protein [Burkholderia ambifaria]
MRTSWLRTLYDLAGWVHPGWLERYGIEAGWPPRLVNHMLVSALPVPVPLTDHSWPSGANTLSRVWYALPAIGYLMGVRCLRDTILARNALTKTPVVARGFLMVPFVPLNGLHAQVDTDRETHYAHAQPAAETALLEEQIQRWGLACLRAAFAHGSPCLHERLALHFAPPVAAGRPAGARAFPVSARACRALFELAVAYHEATYDAKTDSAAA